MTIATPGRDLLMLLLQVLAVQVRGVPLSSGLAELTWPLPRFCETLGVAPAEVHAWAVLAEGSDWGASDDAQGRRNMLELGCALAALLRPASHDPCCMLSVYHPASHRVLASGVMCCSFLPICAAYSLSVFCSEAALMAIGRKDQRTLDVCFPVCAG